MNQPASKRFVTEATGAAKFGSKTAGLLAKSDPHYRTLASRITMTTPPTITVGTNTATITGQTIAKSDARLDYIGPIASTPDTNFYLAQQPRRADGTFDTNTVNNMLGVEFMFDGQAFEYKSLKTSAQVLITIDGQYASPTATATGSGGTTVYTKVDLGSRGRRRIGLWFANGYFGGLQIATTDTIWPTGASAIPTLGFLGDSYTVYGPNSSFNHGFNTYAQQLGRQLGFRTITQFCASGTGFVKSNSASSGTGSLCGPYSTRLADLVAFKPDIVIVQGSINDFDIATDVLGTAAASLYSAIVAALPTTPIIATGTLDARPTTGQGTAAARDAVLAPAAAAAGLPFVPTAGWVTGTGNFTAANGTGNADYYAWGDVTHPKAPEGGDYLASRLYDGIRKLLV